MADDITYTVYDLVNNIGIVEAKERATTKENHFDIQQVTDEGSQKILSFGLSAKNDIGTSDIVTTGPIVLGKPYTLPLVEKVLPTGLKNYWWTDNTGKSGFGLTSSNSSDGDGSSLMFESSAPGDTAWLNSGKVALTDAKNPMAIFSHYAVPGSDIKLDVLAGKPDGSEMQIGTIDYAQLSGTEGWTTAYFTLGKDLVTLPYVILKFRAAAAKKSQKLYIDNICLRDVVANDLSVAVTAPESLKKGTSGNISITVTNNGNSDVQGYKLTLSDGNTELESYNPDEPLAPFASRKFDYTYQGSALDKAVSVRLTASVEYAEDSKTDNSSAAATVTLAETGLPSPQNATAQNNGSGGVLLQWMAPSDQPYTVTDDFEDYEPWSVDNFGEWSSFYGDKGVSGAMFRNLAYPHQGEKFAYMVFNPTDWQQNLLELNPDLTPKSGNQTLMAAWSMGPTSVYDSDDWLVSPELSGKEQTITFYAKNINLDNQPLPETFDVLYSQGGTSKADFVKGAGKTMTAESGSWEKFSATVPEGAKRFAIHHNTEGETAYFFFIDDVTYSVAAKTPTGYNIYRDGIKLAHILGAELSYSDTDVAEGRHEYSITAVYAEGESAPVTASVTSAIAITSESGNKCHEVFTIGGQLVGRDLKALESLKPGVYVIDGVKTVVE